VRIVGGISTRSRDCVVGGWTRLYCLRERCLGGGDDDGCAGLGTW
jgi:hypothetical protein